jgi:hypothetical protein
MQRVCTLFGQPFHCYVMHEEMVSCTVAVILLAVGGLTPWCLPVVLLQLAPGWKVHKKQCKQVQQEVEATAPASATKR